MSSDIVREYVDRIVGSVRFTMCLLHPCPSWLVKIAGEKGGALELAMPHCENLPTIRAQANSLEGSDHSTPPEETVSGPFQFGKL